MKKKNALLLTGEEMALLSEALTMLDDDIQVFGTAKAPAQTAAATRSAIAKLLNPQGMPTDQNELPLSVSELLAAKYALSYVLEQLASDEAIFISPSLSDTTALQELAEKLTNHLLSS